MSTTILQPEQWGMRWVRPPHRQTHPVGRVYVHQTAGVDPVEEYPSGDDRPEDAFRALNEYAINGKGYSAVDYSMLVHTGPSLRTTIGIARGEWVPAATLDDNQGSKAVCLLGWYGPPDPRYPWTFTHARVPFAQELDAIAEAVVHGIHRGWIAHDHELLGHRDNPHHPMATACPGDWLYAELPAIRSRITALLAPPPPTKEPHMLILHRRRGTPEWDAMIWTGTHLAGARDDWSLDALRVAGVAEVDVPDDDRMDRIIHSGQTTNDCPPSMAKVKRLAASWAARRA